VKVHSSLGVTVKNILCAPKNSLRAYTFLLASFAASVVCPRTLQEKSSGCKLRDHERARLQKEEDQVFAKVTAMKNIKPLSNKLREWMPKQWEIYKIKKGLDMDQS
jgi:hypothetical protein